MRARQQQRGAQAGGGQYVCADPDFPLGLALPIRACSESIYARIGSFPACSLPALLGEIPPKATVFQTFLGQCWGPAKQTLPPACTWTLPSAPPAPAPAWPDLQYPLGGENGEKVLMPGFP